MKTFIVVGEYGPCAYDYIERAYRAKTKENALKRFEKEIKKDYGQYMWHNMRTNCNVSEVK